MKALLTQVCHKLLKMYFYSRQKCIYILFEKCMYMRGSVSETFYSYWLILLLSLLQLCVCVSDECLTESFLSNLSMFWICHFWITFYICCFHLNLGLRLLFLSPANLNISARYLCYCNLLDVYITASTVASVTSNRVGIFRTFILCLVAWHPTLTTLVIAHRYYKNRFQPSSPCSLSEFLLAPTLLLSVEVHLLW